MSRGAMYRFLGLLGIGLLLVSCGPKSDADKEQTTIAGEELTRGEGDSDFSLAACVERYGHPCNLGDVSSEVRDLEATYLTELNAVWTRAGRDAAFEWVMTQPSVVDGHLDQTTLMFRIDGGMPFHILTPIVDKQAGAEASLFGGQLVSSDDVAPSETPVGLFQPPVADVVGMGTSRQNPENRKRVLLLEPYAELEGSVLSNTRGDIVAMFSAIDDYMWENGFNHISDSAVTPEWFTRETWRLYDFIYVSTHGGYYAEGDAMFETGIRALWEPMKDSSGNIMRDSNGDAVYSSSDSVKLCNEILAPWVDPSGNTTLNGVSCGENRPDGEDYRFVTVDVTQVFFDEQYGNGQALEKAIVYIEACQSHKFPGLGDTIAGDSSIFLGWSEYVTLNDAQDAGVFLVQQMTKRSKPVGAALETACNAGQCGGPNFKDHVDPDPPPFLEANTQDAGPNSLRLYDLATFKDPKSPTNVLEGGAELRIKGVAGDGNDDQLEIIVDVRGVIHPEDTSPNPDDLLNAALEGPAADRYFLRFFVGEDESEIGFDNLGEANHPRGSSVQLSGGDENTWRYVYTADLGFDVEEGGMETTLKVEVTLPEGGISDSEIDVVLIDAEVGATITVDGRTWEFQLYDGGAYGYCIVGNGVTAAGYVDDPVDGVTFSGTLTETGGELTVDDRVGANQRWMAAADRAGMTDLHLVPQGQSQIDYITWEGNVISGTATFIDTVAFRNYLRFDGPEPAPVTGSFEIRCDQDLSEIFGDSG